MKKCCQFSDVETFGIRFASHWLRAGLAALFVGMTICGTIKAEDGKSLVAMGAKPQKMAGGFKFTEGPAADKHGNVFFTDIPNSRIHKWSTDGKLTTYRENTGRTNGLFFDRDGNLLACEGGNRRVTSISPEGKVKVLADRYRGGKFNSPNDLWIAPNGGIYFTDPRYGNQDGLEQNGFHVYFIPPGGKKVTRILDDLKKPNGIIGSKDASASGRVIASAFFISWRCG